MSASSVPPSSQRPLPVEPLSSPDPLIVYIDFKSPYAYLAIEPTLALGRELGIAIDWRSFVLDIPSYLGSAKLDKAGKVASSNRSASQWSGVKYAYFDCRRYANLTNLTIRGTEKIWDTQLPAIGLLWVQQCADPELLERYLQAVLQPFWRRELDVENGAVITQVLVEVGAPVAGFAEFMRGPGRAANDQLQTAAFNAGVFGVPSYVVDGEVFFGREHLPLVRQRLMDSATPVDVAYELPPQARMPTLAEAPDELVVAIDFASPECLLAIGPTLAFTTESKLPLTWLPASGGGLKPPQPASADDDRGATHRRLRAESRARYLALYAAMNLAQPVADLYVSRDTQAANAGLLWANAAAAQSGSPVDQAAVDRYVWSVFTRFWLENQSIATPADIEVLLDQQEIPGFAQFWAEGAFDALAQNTRELEDRRFISAPTYFFAGEPYVGREHLPLLTALQALGALQDAD